MCFSKNLAVDAVGKMVGKRLVTKQTGSAGLKVEKVSFGVCIFDCVLFCFGLLLFLYLLLLVQRIVGHSANLRISIFGSVSLNKVMLFFYRL